MKTVFADAAMRATALIVITDSDRFPPAPTPMQNLPAPRTTIAAHKRTRRHPWHSQ